MLKTLKANPLWISVKDVVNEGAVKVWRDSMVRLVRAAGGGVRLQVAPKPQTRENSFYKKQGMKKAA
jgi:hypothetical protein